ncbi:MAG: hypothetical protein Q9227_006510 [Pyrenula ochraceoflavens]
MQALLSILLSLLLVIQSRLTLSALTPIDRFQIYEQLNLHQAYIDHDASHTSALAYASLYWPEATFTVNDLGNIKVFSGLDQIKSAYDYDHSVYPIYQWAHTLGPFVITEVQGNENQANVQWRWRVDWKANETGVVSTGRYEDLFERRAGLWKILKKLSVDDENWPLVLFNGYTLAANLTFRSS